MDMAWGGYDSLLQACESRGRTGHGIVTYGADGFRRAEGITTVVADPIPSVLCDITSNIDLTGLVSDPETPLGSLVIISDSPAFVAWHPSTTEL